MWKISGGRISFKVTDNSRWGEANEKTFIQINVAQFYIETPSDYSLRWVVFSLRSNTYNKKSLEVWIRVQILYDDSSMPTTTVIVSKGNLQF